MIINEYIQVLLYIKYENFKKIPNYLLDLGFRFQGEWDEEYTCMRYTPFWGKYPLTITFYSLEELHIFLEKKVNGFLVQLLPISKSEWMMTIDNYDELTSQWEFDN